VAREDASFFTQTTRGCRMDLTLPAGELRHGEVPALLSHAALLDLTCVDPLAPANLQASAITDGATANAAAQTKHDHYSGTFSPASAKLWPLANESYGRWCAEAEVFFGALAQHVAGTEVHPQPGRNLKGVVLHRLRQVMSIALQRGLHRSVTGFTAQVARARTAGRPALQDDLDRWVQEARGADVPGGGGSRPWGR